MPTARSDRAGSRHRTPGVRHRVALALALACLAVVAVPAAPASASPIIDAQAIALSTTATCEDGDVEITYAADGVERQAAQLTSEDGTLLDAFESPAYQSVYTGSEYILTTVGTDRGVPIDPPPAVPTAGTVLGVYVTLGSTPPTADNGEFFLLYRCDTTRNDRGGDNVVLLTCVGDYGTCPTTAQEALAPEPTTTSSTTSSTTTPGEPPSSAGEAAPAAAAPPARPVVAQPRYTG